MACASDRIGDRVVLLHQLESDFELLVVGLVFLDCRLPELALFLRSPAEAEDDRQSYLTFAEVVTDILAEARRIARVIERIIDKLEGKSKIGAVRAQRCPIRLGGIRYNWAYLGCRRKER